MCVLYVCNVVCVCVCMCACVVCMCVCVFIKCVLLVCYRRLFPSLRVTTEIVYALNTRFMLLSSCNHSIVRHFMQLVSAVL